MSPRALVVGGGYAGAAAATALAQAGVGVDLLESRGFLGGRVYSIVNDRFPLPVDNGPHLLMGCYREAFRFFDRLGLKDGFERVDPLELRWISPGGGSVSLKCPAIPAPFHLAAGILSSDAFPGTEKWKLMAALAPFAVKPFPLPRRARTVADWMDLTRQSPVTRGRFWVPLCRAVMNVPPEAAPLRGFGEVLRRIFFGSRKNGSLVVPAHPLSEIAFPQVAGYLQARDGAVHLREGARDLRLTSGPFQVGTVTGRTYTADVLILALPPRSLESLWNSSGLPSPVQEKRLGRSPILSVHLIVEKKVMEGHLAGLPGSAFDWVFNRNANWGYAGPGQYLSLVSSADPDLSSKPEKEVLVRAWEEMQDRFPALAGTQPLHAKVTREMAATFLWTEASESARPPCATAFPKVFLAGDWTHTHLPATIEGACLSGHRAAAAALRVLRGA